jgi:hypothetical protein
MSDPIAEFLLRAAERLAQQRPANVQVVEADVVEDAEVVQADDVSGEDVAKHVARHLDTSGIVSHATHLGADIDQADDVMDAHLRDVFEHRLGDLPGRSIAAKKSVLDDKKGQAKAQEPADKMPGIDVRDMLKRPQDLRSAIILSEILRRPEYPW